MNIMVYHISANNDNAKKPIAYGGFWQTLQIKSSQNPQDELLMHKTNAT